MKTRHHYLNNLGIPSNAITTFGTTAKDSARAMAKYYAQRKKYGFDVRETYALDITMAGWLYAHLQMYLAASSQRIDHSVKKYDISVLRPLPEGQRRYVISGNIRLAERYFSERMMKAVPRSQ